MTTRLGPMSWPAPELGVALDHLARLVGLSSQAQRETPSTQVIAAGPASRGRWIEAAADTIGVEVEPDSLTSSDLDARLGALGPSLIEFEVLEGVRYLAVIKSNRRYLQVLGPDMRAHRVAVERAAAWLTDNAAVARDGVDAALAEAGVSVRRGVGWFGTCRVAGQEASVATSYAMHAPAGSPFLRQLHSSGTLGRLVWLIVAHAAQYVLLVLAWTVVGRSALDGRFDPGWAVAWALLLLTIIPIRLFETWMSGMAAIGIGGLLRRRLLAGALNLEPEEVRHKGAGQFLAAVFEAEAVEVMGVGGGLLGLVSAIELAVALVVLALGAGGAFHAFALILAVALGGWACGAYFTRRKAWTRTRLDMTDDLVERILGHRTRLAQEAPDRWHEGEEQQLEQYFARSVAVDRAATALALLPRGWLLVGMVTLVPAFTSGQTSTAALAVGLGGTLAAWRAFEKLAQSAAQLVSAALSWAEIAPLFHAAGRPNGAGHPEAVAAPNDRRPGAASRTAAIDADRLVFRYATRAEAVLRHGAFRINHGDRVLVQGPSGGGKSTLASLLVGLRAPESGLLLLDGLDRPTLGAGGWRRRAVAAPQFHENHVLTGSLAFNLLMGRRWPAAAGDLEEAEAVCRELGLGGLLDRMPSGLLQLVGESGWLLSHGERSRLFVARALLQRADLVVLDESFAALDPDTLQHAMQCVLRRAPTLVVIAHP